MNIAILFIRLYCNVAIQSISYSRAFGEYSGEKAQKPSRYKKKRGEGSDSQFQTIVLSHTRNGKSIATIIKVWVRLSLEFARHF